MAATAVQTETSSAQLPPLREDLKLLPGSPHRDGSPSWRIHDPLRNQFFEIGWLEFELLVRWSANADAAGLIGQVEEETTLSPTLAEIEELVAFLNTNQLLAPGSARIRGDLRMRLRRKSRPWYETLLHHYLFFRVPLVRPDAFLQRTLPAVEIFFTRGFGVLVVLVLLADLFLVMRQWHSFRESFVHFMSLKGVLYYALAGTFAKIVHELGHAYVAKRHGVRVPAMGLAFLVLWPYLYTDTAETWKLSDRRKQLQIASAGMLSELVLAVFATLLWSLCPEGGLKSILFILATTTWVMTLAINASPFMRFDGYFVLSDVLDFPNLHERGAASAQWFIRKTFFRLNEPDPEPTLGRRQFGWLVAFAVVTWVYRLTVFIGIALLVYHIALKLLGIVLMLIEIVWFVIAPVMREMAYLWGRRDRVRIALVPVSLAVIGAVVVVWIVPVSNQVTAPAIMRAENEQAVYAPMAARISRIAVEQGQRVEAGDVLIVLDVPEFGARSRQAEVAIASTRAELQRAPASTRQQEQRAVLQERLAEAVAQQQAVIEESDRLELRAVHAGTIRDVATDLEQGRWLGPREKLLVQNRWVNPQEMLMRVVSDSVPVIEMFVGETQVEALVVGQRVRFYPDVPRAAAVNGTITAIDKTPIRQIQQPLLASGFGGKLATFNDPKEGLVAYDATFRVFIRPGDGVPSPQFLTSGTARVETDIRFVSENFFSRLISILIRESSF